MTSLSKSPGQQIIINVQKNGATAPFAKRTVVYPVAGSQFECHKSCDRFSISLRKDFHVASPSTSPGQQAF